MGSSMKMGMDFTCAVLLFWFSSTLGQGQGPLIPDLPCDDIFEENIRLKAENVWLKDVIRDNITQLTEMIQSNSQNIQDTADNLGIVEKRVTSNDGNIVSTNRRVDENKAYINENEANIERNMNDITNLNLAPVGTISAWVTKPTKETSDNDMVNLPDGWVRCDGSPIPQPSIWAELLTPNLNGEKRFLRGASDEDVLTLEEDQIQEHVHKIADPGHNHGYVDRYTWADGDHHESGHWGPGTWADTDYDRFDQPHDGISDTETTGIKVDGVLGGRTGDETRPKNMNVVFIMKVW